MILPPSSSRDAGDRDHLIDHPMPPVPLPISTQNAADGAQRVDVAADAMLERDFPAMRGRSDSLNMAAAGIGALSDSTVSIGRGDVRAEGQRNAAAAASYYSAAASSVSALGAQLFKAGALVSAVAVMPITVPLGLAAKYHAGQIVPVHEEQYRAAHALPLAALEVPEADSLAADPAVMARVVSHAAGQNSTVTPDALTAYVAAGEKIAQALIAKSERIANDAGAAGAAGSASAANAENALRPETPILAMHVGGQDITVRSSVYTTRALSWYLMAKAAQQDCAQEAFLRKPGDPLLPSNMATSGSFLLKDPHNTFFDFLSSAPTAGDRISTHFNERADHDRRHGFIPGKAIQRGIEDYSDSLPGEGGTMLFDKLRAPNGDLELFIKFEATGCPPLFQTQNDEGVGRAPTDHVVQFFSAIHRNLAHALSFAHGQKTADAQTVMRQEHVVKGILKDTVAAPFKAVIKMAQEGDLFDGSAIKSLSVTQAMSAAKSHGLPFIHSELDRITLQALDRDMPDIAKHVTAVKVQIKDEEDRLGAVSDSHGIQRRGAEVHLSWANASPSK